AQAREPRASRRRTATADGRLHGLLAGGRLEAGCACARAPHAASAQAQHQVALGFGATSCHRPREVPAFTLHGPVARGRLLDRECVGGVAPAPVARGVVLVVVGSHWGHASTEQLYAYSRGRGYRRVTDVPTLRTSRKSRASTRARPRYARGG